MKKIIFITVIIIFIPFLIVNFYKIDEKEEIKIKYMSNTIIRVKRMGTGNIDSIPFEEYIVGVLAGEMPIYFEKEAFKAQAVAARSYAFKRMEYNKDNDYDVVDSIMNQVYLDDNYLKDAWGDDYINNINKLREVVNETSMEYLEYDGEVIDALFFSTSNGYTETASLVFDVDLPYLKSVKSSWDEKTSSAFRNNTSMDINSFYKKLGLSYSDSFDFKVLKRSSTNRIVTLSINGKEFTGKSLYDKLGLRSLDFSLKKDGDKIIISTTGYGHGVGMSQYGALGMAQEGYDYKDILKYYYSGTEIKKNGKLMYIILVLGNNYIRGDKMKNRRIKSFFVPVIYGTLVLAFLFSMFFVGKFANNLLFSKKDNNIKYVDGEITEGANRDIPVVSTNNTIVKPYLSDDVKIAKSFYDYKDSTDNQEKAIIFYENTYMQNSGVDYASENVFDVISILDGTVISVENNDIMGTTIEIRHNNDLISVYQSLSDVTVSKDDKVIQGQIIAKSGLSNIEKDMGNHLHFELYHKGKIVNPEEFYNKSLDEL